MILQQCTDNKSGFNQIAKLEQQLSVRTNILSSPIIATQGNKINIIREIIRVLEFYLEVNGKKLETYQIQVLAGDLYDRFKNDTLDDVIMMFKMIRNGELLEHAKFNEFGDKRDKRYNESFNEKIMMYVDFYMDYKAQEREKLINEQKRKLKQKEQNTTMSDEAYAKFTELQSRITTPIQRNKEVFSINKTLASLDSYLERLPETCKKLSDGDLKYEIMKTESSNKAAHQILLSESWRRKELKQKKK